MFDKIKNLVSELGNAIDKNFTSKEEKNNALIELKKIELSVMETQNKHQAEILKLNNEAEKNKPETWLVKNWRPFLFVTIIIIILNNYLLSPWFGFTSVEMDDNLWTLIQFGVGGYTLFLGGSRLAKEVRKKDS